MKTKLTEGERKLLARLAARPDGISWALLSGPENGHGTRLQKKGLVARLEGRYGPLTITDAGRAALEGSK